MTIERIATEQLAEIIAGLVKQGLTFQSWPDPKREGYWWIELTGGY